MSVLVNSSNYDKNYGYGYGYGYGDDHEETKKKPWYKIF